VVPQVQEPIHGIVSTAQGDGAWLVDDHGNPTGNAILWNDGRANDLITLWHGNGIASQAFRVNGSVAYAGLPNAIFTWLDQNEPQRIRQARWSLTCNGWIHAQLTGRFVADLSDASNPFCDIRRGEYAAELTSLYGVAEYASLLPCIVRMDQAVAPLTESAARQLNLKPGIDVVIAPYDIAAMAYGSRATDAGKACVILGTTLSPEVITTSLDLTGTPSGTSIALDNGLFLRAMPTLTGCEALDWTASMLNLNGLEQLDKLATQAEAGSGGVLFLPYLSPAGERSPFLDPAAKGSFNGVTLRTGRKEMARAVYEGLSFVIRECLEAATKERVHAIHLCGGGARSDFWCQMIADVTGIMVVRSAEREVGARGAFVFALAATGRVISLTEGAQTLHTEEATFQPDAVLHDIYSQQFTTFCRLRDLAINEWQLWMKN
ncbi:MAG TPA: FGGY-family carbohydrate kinase, partial [Edaphobacter sp.]|nr:FGGY-family carbohydrate kinase [Edaphobacter sp.]